MKEMYSGMTDANDLLVAFVLAASSAFTVSLLSLNYLLGLFTDFHFLGELSALWNASQPLSKGASYALQGVLIFSFVVGSGVTYFIGRGAKMEVHISGKQLGEGPKLLQQIEKPLIKRSGAGIKIGDLILSRQREPGHMLFIGMPGSGKTVTLNSICKQIHVRGDRMVVHDPKGDYVQWFDPETTAIFGPWDKRTVLWDISADLRTAADLQEAAATWVPDKEGDNADFAKGGQQFLLGLLFYLFKELKSGKIKDWGFRDLSLLLQKAPEDSVPMAISGFAPAALTLGLDKEGRPTKTTQSILFSCSSNLMWIHQLAAIERPDRLKISFQEWMRNPDTAKKNLILKNDSNYEKTAVALFGTVIGVMKKTISQLPEVKPSAPGCWFLIDEFPQVGKQSGRAIAGLQEVGRSKGIRVITAAQNIHQIYEIFDKDAGDSLTDLQQTKVYAQMSEQAAQKVSELSTKKLVNRHGVNLGDKVTGSYSASEVPVLSELDLRALRRLSKGVEVIVVIEAQPVKLVVPYPKINSNQPQFVINEDYENGLLNISEASKPAVTEVTQEEEEDFDYTLEDVQAGFERDTADFVPVRPDDTVDTDDEPVKA